MAVMPAPGTAAATTGAAPAPSTATPQTPASIYGEMSGVMGNIFGQYAPAIYGGQLQATNAVGQGLLTGASANVDFQQLLQSTGLSEAAIGLQQQNIGQQEATAAGQQALELGTYGLQQQQLALTPQELALQQQYLGTEEAVAQQQYGTAVTAQQGAGAASGASNTVTQRQAMANLASGYAQQMAGYQEQGGQLGLQQQNAAIQQQLAVLGQASETLGYQGQQSQLVNAMAQQGISYDQAAAQLQYGAQQIGVSAGADIMDDLVQAMQQGGAAADQAASMISAMVVSGGGNPTQVLNALNKSVG